MVAGCAPSVSREEAGRKKPATTREREPAPPPVAPPTRRPAPPADSYSIPPSKPPPKSPQQVAALHRVDRAKALIAKGEYMRAISDLEKTLSLDATNPLVYFYLARAHHELAHFEESLDFLEVADSFSGEASVSRTELLILQGDNLRRLGRLSEARQSYQQALAIDPGNEKARARLRLVAKQS